MRSEPIDLPAQSFVVSHLNESDFKSGGLRSYSAYRDLGIAAATKGLATGHVIRMTAPFTEEQRQKHHHNVDFQLVYVLKGWFKNGFFVNFTGIFPLLRDNPVIQYFQLEHERHRAV